MEFKLTARIFEGVKEADRYLTDYPTPLEKQDGGIMNLHMAEINGVKFAWREGDNFIIVNVIVGDKNYAITKHK